MRKLFIFKVYFVLFFLFFAIKSQAQESIMTDFSYPYLEKLIAVAKANYPQVKIKQEQVIIAQNTYLQSRNSWYDAFSFSYIYSPQTTLNLAATSAFTSLFTGYQFAISYNLGNLLEKRYTIRNSKESLTIAQLEQQTYDLNIAFDVKKRYITYIQQMAILRLRTKSSLDAESIFNQTKHQFENGNETIDSYTKASLAFTENNQSRLDAEAAALIAKSSLEEILGEKLEDVK